MSEGPLESPPLVILGQTLQTILRNVSTLRGFFTAFRCLVLTGPWSTHTSEGRCGKHPDVKAIFETQGLPVFQSLLFGLFKRYFD